MNRDLTASVITELTADVARPRLFFEVELESTTFNYWTGSYDVIWDSKTWLGNGFLKDFNSIEEDAEITANGLEVVIVGEPSALISVALQSLAQNKTGTLYLGFLDASDSIIADPFILFQGKVDTVDLVDDVTEASIRFTFESALVNLDDASNLRLNQEAHHANYSSDLGFEYLEQLSKGWSGYWGKTQRYIKRQKRRRERKRRR